MQVCRGARAWLVVGIAVAVAPRAAGDRAFVTNMRLKLQQLPVRRLWRRGSDNRCGRGQGGLFGHEEASATVGTAHGAALVERADGRIAFAPGSRAFREQRARLIDEGVCVKAGRIDLARYGWQRNIDEEIWRL